MKVNAALLKSKGWGEDEISRASRIIDQAESRKHAPQIILDHTLFWLGLIASLVGTLVAAAFLFPLVALLPGNTVYFVVGLTGFCLGMLFSVMMKDVEKATRQHHLLAIIVVAIGGTMAFVSMVNLANATGIASAEHSVIGISLTFIIFFLLPYIFFLTEEKMEWFDLAG